MESTEVKIKTKWTIDSAHSEIAFTVKHLVFSNVRGIFREFSADVYTSGNDIQSAEIFIRINPASVDTSIEQRDQHLRSTDFFDVEEFNEIRFVSDNLVVTNGDRHIDLYGYLTIKGVTKPVKLDVKFGAFIKDPWGAEKALLSVSGKIKRKDWGLNYNAVLEAGGLVVGEEVWIQCEVQLIKQAT